MLPILSVASYRRGLLLGGFLVAALCAVFVLYARPPAASVSADDGSGVNILLGLADDALRAGHRVAPEGSNVYEFYASVLQLDPQNQIATKRLRDAFASACDDLEHTIDKGELDEAQRELRLLHDYDATSYRLSLLDSYLYAQRMQLVRQHEAEAVLIQQQRATAIPGTE